MKSNALADRQEPEQKVLGADVVVAQQARLLLRLHDRKSRAVGEPLEEWEHRAFNEMRLRRVRFRPARLARGMRSDPRLDGRPRPHATAAQLDLGLRKV